MNSKIKLVKFKNTLRTFNSSVSLSDAIINKIVQIPKFQDLQQDVELILFICSSVENGLKNDVKTDKKQMVLDIMKKIFPTLTQEEQTFIGNTIQFLFNNGSIVRFSDWYHFFLKVVQFFSGKSQKCV